MKLLTENNNHVFISGITRSGKSYFAAQALAQLSRPVLFLNIQDEQLPACFLTVRYDEVDTGQLLETLRSGGKIDFRLPLSVPLSNNVQAHIIDSLMKADYSQEKPIYIAIDECQLLKNRGLDKAVELATRGLKRGCRAVFITQRPALADKTLYTQSAEQYIFRCSQQEKEYLKNKGLDYDACAGLWEQNGEHSYIFTDGFTLEGRRAI